MQRLTEYFIVPQNAVLLNLVGFTLGLIGFFLTLWGLRIALEQLRGLKSEAEATRAAIQKVQLKVSSFDTLQEIAGARKTISSIRTVLIARSAKDLIPLYEQLIEMFLRISHAGEAISSEDREVMKRHTSEMAKICEGLRKRVSTNADALPPRGQDEALRNYTDITTKIGFALRQELQK
ncbi:hypothetical protein V6R86_03160 [Sphingomonas kaistensis]|uniref:DUF4760 domain-containing protein n=1 Tax=Sphingomonas kaistensis TaxID=298708 RepID=A0ABZ2FY29_9SPHN